MSAGRLFQDAVWLLGPMHMLHSVTKGITSKLTEFDTVFKPMLQKLVKWLKAPWMIERFKEQCLNEGMAYEMRASTSL